MDDIYSRVVPESRKVMHVDIGVLRSAEDCDVLIDWLDAQLRHMANQLDYKKARGWDDPVWLSKINLAARHTKHLRNRVSHIRGRLSRAERVGRQSTLERAFMDAVLDIFDPDDIAEIWDEIYSQHPELKP